MPRGIEVGDAILITRPHVWQYGTSSPCVRYKGGGVAVCLDGRDQESSQDIVVTKGRTVGAVGHRQLRQEESVR